MKHLWFAVVLVLLPAALSAQYDSTYYPPAKFELGKETGMEGSTVRVPLRISDGAYNGLELAPWTFGVMFDDYVLEFQRITLAAGNPYQSLPLTWWPIPGGVHIGLESPVMVYDTATLFYLEFDILSIDDTSCVELEIVNWYFNGGRVRPVLQDGEVCMVPIPPRPKGSMEMPHELTWVRSKRDYVPNPFTVRAAIHNEAGGDVAKRVMFKIDYDPADFELVSPITDIQPGSLLNVDSNETSEASWLVKARTRLTGDSVMIAVTAIFDNHPDIVMYQKMWIPPPEPVLRCSLPPVMLTADYKNNRYQPMPFDVTVHVFNDGSMATDSVYARIEIPPALSLAGDDAPNHTSKKIEPGRLQPYKSGTVSWALSCPLFENDTSFVVLVWVRTANADSSLCEALVHLPAMGVPSLRAADQCPDKLTFNEATGKYDPNPFFVTITAVNLANTPAQNVTAYLYLPDGVVLDPPGQSLRQDFGTLERWQTGDPIPIKHITVRWNKILPYNTVAEFRWVLGGVSSLSGAPLDSVWAYSETDIPGVGSSVECELSVPEKLVWNADTGDYIPNPFTVSYTVRNTGFVPVLLKRLVCYFNHDGVTFDASVPGNAETRVIADSLYPGDTAVYSWVLVAEPSLMPRTIHFNVSVLYDSDEVLMCEDDVPIEFLKAAIGCGGGECPEEIDFDTARQRYDPETFIVTHSLVNYGTAPLTNARIRITKKYDPGSYIAFDSRFGDPEEYQVPHLTVEDTFRAVWHMRIARPNLTGTPVVVEFAFNYESDETPYIEYPCSAFTTIRPAVYRSVENREVRGDTVQRVDTVSQTFAVKSDGFGAGYQSKQTALTCSIDSIHITADNEDQRYSPMPFTLTARILNAGETVTDSVYATIMVPYDLELHGPDAPDGNTKALSRKYLFPGDTASVSWEITHPITLTERTYNIRVWIKTKHGDSTWCETQVVIPALDAPSLRASCTVPDRIDFSEEQDSYVPNPFEVQINVLNYGKMTADSVTAFLYLPDGVELDPPGQPLHVDFGSMENWRPGDSIPKFTWTVRWPDRTRYDTTLEFKWAVGGVGRSGVPTDTVYAYCETDIGGITPKLLAHCGGVGGYVCTTSDSLRWDTENNTYTPNPFWTRLRITNIGFIEFTLERMACYVYDDGVAFDTTMNGNTEIRDLGITLQPGDSVVQYWWFNARPWIDDRAIPIQMFAYGKDELQWSHKRYINIPGVESCLGYRDNNSTRLIDYDSSLQWYTERRITLSNGLYNCGDWKYNDPWIEITLDDPEGYLMYDTAYANPPRTTADKLLPGDTLYGTWRLRLAKPNTTGVPQIVNYKYNFGADELPHLEPDWHYLVIEPAIVTGIDEFEQPNNFSLGSPYPNPFSSVTEIPYTLAREVEVRIAVHYVLGKEVAALVNKRMPAGQHRTLFDGAALPGGVYIVRMSAGSAVLSRMILLQR